MERERGLNRPDHKGYRPLAQEESKRTRNDCCHRYEAENDVELTRKDAASQLSRGATFKNEIKRTAESGQGMRGIVVLKNPNQCPGKKALEQWHPDHLDSAKRGFCVPQGVFNGRSSD